MSTSRRTFVQVAAATTGAALGLDRFVRAQPAPAVPAGASQRMLVLGGTRFLGPAIVDAALAAGHTVTLFNRGRSNPEMYPDIEKLVGDRDGGLDALKGREWDVVLDTSGYVPRLVRDAAELLKDHVGHYVFISSISVYADPSKSGITESAPLGTMPDETVEEVNGETYGPLKALCEQAAEAAMPGRVTNVRPGLIVGPRDSSRRFLYWPVRMERGGAVLAPGPLDVPIQIIDARDLGAWSVRAGADRIAGVFNATGPASRMTIADLVYGCKAVTTGDATVTWVDETFLTEHDVRPWGDLPCWLPTTSEVAGFNAVDSSRAIAAGMTFRCLADTAADTLEWYHALDPERRARVMGGLSPERESELLAAWAAVRPD